jgi:hypothetical protein
MTHAGHAAMLVWLLAVAPPTIGMTKERCEAEQIVSSQCWQLRCGRETCVSQTCYDLMLKVREKAWEHWPYGDRPQPMGR